MKNPWFVLVVIVLVVLLGLFAIPKTRCEVIHGGKYYTFHLSNGKDAKFCTN